MFLFRFEKLPRLEIIDVMLKDIHKVFGSGDLCIQCFGGRIRDQVTLATHKFLSDSIRKELSTKPINFTFFLSCVCFGKSSQVCMRFKHLLPLINKVKVPSHHGAFHRRTRTVINATNYLLISTHLLFF